MTRTKDNLNEKQNIDFDNSTHLFATNEYAINHNRKMLKNLSLPIVHSTARVVTHNSNEHIEDEQLPQEVLLCIGQQVMLTTNLWIQTGLVNGSIGQVNSIVYDTISSPPNLPKYVVVKFDNYTGPPWDAQNPKIVLITPITRGSRTQIPLTMAWAITIHKSQGLTLNRATIDIGRRERQGLTFTTISRVKDLNL